MKKALSFLFAGFILSIVLTLFFNQMHFDNDSFTALGLANLIIGIIGVFIGGLLALFKEEIGKPILIASGLLMLIGLVTCSMFPI